MESLKNKRKSNKNLIGHSKEKKQDLSVRTEEKIKTGNTEEKNHVDEIGSMVEGEVAKETVLPSWMGRKHFAPGAEGKIVQML